MQNLRLAFRSLRKTPFVTAVAVASLALGIGVNASIYSSFDQLLLRSVPGVPNARQLVTLSELGPKGGMTTCSDAGSCDVIFSYPMFRDLEKAMPAASAGLAAHRSFGTNLTFGAKTE